MLPFFILTAHLDPMVLHIPYGLKVVKPFKSAYAKEKQFSSKIKVHEREKQIYINLIIEFLLLRKDDKIINI